MIIYIIIPFAYEGGVCRLHSSVIDNVDNAIKQNNITEEPDARFNVATRLIIYITVFVTIYFLQTSLSSLPLSIFLILVLTLSHKDDMAKSFLIFYIVLFVIYLLMFVFHVHLFIFSAPKILQIIGMMPTFLALVILLSAPPGLLSASLARVHVPKKIIVGMLVVVRFFPTVAMFWSKWRDAVRMRSLFSFSSMMRNPMLVIEYIVVPLMLSLATSADKLSTSAIARAAESPHPRTSYYYRRVGITDIAAIVATVSVCVLCVFLSRTGVL
ncbi:MAG: hypothetical protein J6M18_03345 [Actinomycetaceae bacterium]|nr:hypothetical protein [Actinomycetaceae bacterium]